MICIDNVFIDMYYSKDRHAHRVEPGIDRKQIAATLIVDVDWLHCITLVYV